MAVVESFNECAACTVSFHWELDNRPFAILSLTSSSRISALVPKKKRVCHSRVHENHILKCVKKVSNPSCWIFHSIDVFYSQTKILGIVFHDFSDLRCKFYYWLLPGKLLTPASFNTVIISNTLIFFRFAPYIISSGENAWRWISGSASLTAFATVTYKSLSMLGGKPAYADTHCRRMIVNIDPNCVWRMKVQIEIWYKYTM